MVNVIRNISSWKNNCCQSKKNQLWHTTAKLQGDLKGIEFRYEPQMLYLLRLSHFGKETIIQKMGARCRVIFHILPIGENLQFLENFRKWRKPHGLEVIAQMFAMLKSYSWMCELSFLNIHVYSRSLHCRRRICRWT